MPAFSPDMLLTYVVIGTLALAAALAMMARPSLAIWILGLMLLGSMLGVTAEGSYEYRATIFRPIQMRRSQIVLGTGLLLYFATFAYLLRGRLGRVSGPAVILLCVGYYASLLRIIHISPMDGLLSAGLVFATTLSIALLIPALLNDLKDWYDLPRMMVVISALWFIGVALQFAANRNMLVVSGNRFLGLTGNPQHAAVMLSVMVVAALWLVINDPKSRYRLFWIALTALNLILLAWTGSRTGMLMLVAGSSVVLWNRLGRSILLIPLVAIAVLGARELVSAMDIDLAADRLLSTENTRAYAWSLLLDKGMMNPMLGVGIIEAGESENSYLLALAAYGVGMVMLVGCLVIASVVQCVRLIAIRPRAGAYRPFIDLVLAYYPMYFLGAMFEGYIVARVDEHIIFLIIFSTIANQLLASRWQLDAAAEIEWDEDQQWDDAHIDFDPDAEGAAVAPHPA